MRVLQGGASWASGLVSIGGKGDSSLWMIEEWSCRHKLGWVATSPSWPWIPQCKCKGLSPESDSDAPFPHHVGGGARWTEELANAGALLLRPRRIWPSRCLCPLSFPMGGQISV